MPVTKDEIDTHIDRAAAAVHKLVNASPRSPSETELRAAIEGALQASCEEANESDLDANADFKAIRMIDGKPMEFGYTNVEFANDFCPHVRFAFAVLGKDRDGLIEAVRGLAIDPRSGGDARLVYDLCEDWHTTECQLTMLAETIRVAGTRTMLVMQAICEEKSPAGKALAKGTEVHIPQYIRERADRKVAP